MTNAKQQRAVDAYFTETIVAPDSALKEALAANAAAGLPSIDVSAPQGKLIHLLARMAGARKALEIGALGGYSTIWIARALPEDGRLISLELDGKRADVARRNVARAGLGGKVEVRTGAALATCPRSRPKGIGPSISSSSTPTRPITRPISNGACGSPGREPQSWSTTSCGTARSSTPTAPIRTSSACAACSRRWRASRGSARPRSRPSAPRAGTVRRSPSWK